MTIKGDTCSLLYYADTRTQAIQARVIMFKSYRCSCCFVVVLWFDEPTWGILKLTDPGFEVRGGVGQDSSDKQKKKRKKEEEQASFFFGRGEVDFRGVRPLRPLDPLLPYESCHLVRRARTKMELGVVAKLMFLSHPLRTALCAPISIARCQGRQRGTCLATLASSSVIKLVRLSSSCPVLAGYSSYTCT